MNRNTQRSRPAMNGAVLESVLDIGAMFKERMDRFWNRKIMALKFKEDAMLNAMRDYHDANVSRWMAFERRRFL